MCIRALSHTLHFVIDIFHHPVNGVHILHLDSPGARLGDLGLDPRLSHRPNTDALLTILTCGTS